MLGEGTTREAVTSGRRLSYSCIPRMGFRSTPRHLSLDVPHVALGFICSPWRFPPYTRGELLSPSKCRQQRLVSWQTPLSCWLGSPSATSLDLGRYLCTQKLPRQTVKVPDENPEAQVFIRHIFLTQETKCKDHIDGNATKACDRTHQSSLSRVGTHSFPPSALQIAFWWIITHREGSLSRMLPATGLAGKVPWLFLATSGNLKYCHSLPITHP